MLAGDGVSDDGIGRPSDVDLAAEVDQALERSVVELLRDAPPLLLLTEDDVRREGLDEMTPPPLLGDVLEDDLHPAVRRRSRAAWWRVGR